jgi:hypothetical protein
MPGNHPNMSPAPPLHHPIARTAQPAPAASLGGLPEEVGCMLFACLDDDDSFSLGRVNRAHWAMFTDDSVRVERLRRVHGLTLPAAARQHSAAAAASCARLAQRTVRGDLIPAAAVQSGAADLHRLEAPVLVRCQQPNLGCDRPSRGNQRFSTFSVPENPRRLGHQASPVRLMARLAPAAAPNDEQFTDLAEAWAIGHYVVALETGLDAQALGYDLTRPMGHLMPQPLRVLQPAESATGGLVAGVVYSTAFGLAIGAADDVPQTPLWRI